MRHGDYSLVASPKNRGCWGVISGLCNLLIVWPFKLLIVFPIKYLIWMPIVLLIRLITLPTTRYLSIVNDTSPSSVIKPYKVHKAHQLDDLRYIDPVTFEKYMAAIFEDRYGYTVQMTPTTGDGGIDIILRKGNYLAIVQCKHYQGSVGEPVARDLYGSMIHTHAHEAFIITTGQITAKARNWCEGKPIHLIDKHNLIKWVESGEF